MSAEDIVSGFARYMGTDGPRDAGHPFKSHRDDDGGPDVPCALCSVVRSDHRFAGLPADPVQSAATGTAPELPGEDGTVPAVPGAQEPSPGVALRTIIEYVLDAAQDPESNATLGGMLDDIEERMDDAGLVARYAWQVMSDEEALEVMADRIDALTRINIDHEPVLEARAQLERGTATFDSPAGAGHGVEADRG